MSLPFPLVSGCVRPRGGTFRWPQGRTSAGQIHYADKPRGVGAVCGPVSHSKPPRRLQKHRGTEATSHHLQVDRAHAALDTDIQGDLRIVVGVNDVRLALPPEALGVDLAQATLGPHPHSDLAWHQHRGLPYPALYAGVNTPGVSETLVRRLYRVGVGLAS